MRLYIKIYSKYKAEKPLTWTITQSDVQNKNSFLGSALSTSKSIVYASESINCMKDNCEFIILIFSSCFEIRLLQQKSWVPVMHPKYIKQTYTTKSTYSIQQMHKNRKKKSLNGKIWRGRWKGTRQTLFGQTQCCNRKWEF